MNISGMELFPKRDGWIRELENLARAFSLQVWSERYVREVCCPNYYFLLLLVEFFFFFFTEGFY